MGEVAIVGCGWAGQKHAAAFIAEGARVRWAVDTDLERASGLAELRPGASVSADLDEPLSDPAVTMVDVCLPHHLHAEACLTVIAKGRDVLCEKPLAPSLADADRVMEAAESAGSVLMVAENECFHPVYLQIQKTLDEGVFGPPALAQATRQCFLRESFRP
jgi:predicted dehydrogenase